MKPTHGVTHWDPEGCFGCKVKTVQYSPTATPTRGNGQTVQQMKAHEKQLDKDLPAFKRMRLEGQTPKSTAGAHRMEALAQTEYEISSGQLAGEVAAKTARRKGVRNTDEGGRQWAKRAQEAWDAVKRDEVISPC